MRGVGSVAAAVFAAVAAAGFCIASAAAEATDRRKIETLLFFSGLDLWRHGAFAHGGAVWSPGGLDRGGFTFKALLGGGEYSYLSGALGNAEVTGRQTVMFAMPGWRFTAGNITATAYAGLDLQHHRLRPHDPAAGLRGGETGLRTAIEFWMQPTTTTMIAADGSVSTIGPSYSARAAFGWQTPAGFYIGPEIQFFAGDNSYRQSRLGWHLTVPSGKLPAWSKSAEGTIAMGWASDSDDRDSLYMRFSVLGRR